MVGTCVGTCIGSSYFAGNVMAEGLYRDMVRAFSGYRACVYCSDVIDVGYGVFSVCGEVSSLGAIKEVFRKFVLEGDYCSKPVYTDLDYISEVLELLDGFVVTPVGCDGCRVSLCLRSFIEGFIDVVGDNFKVEFEANGGVIRCGVTDRGTYSLYVSCRIDI